MNKDKRNNIQLLGTLNNADESGIIANASQIYDANENKSTQDVSKEHTERIKTLEDKENELIAAVGTGGSVDTRITNAVNVEKTRAEGAESTLDGKITAEQTRAANAENALDGRVDTLEEAVGTGGSVDSKIASAVDTETSRAQEAEANRYTKNETYTKEEVNNLITTPNQEYVSVTATDQTTAVTDVLPAIGLANTVYRVGSWDGSQYDVTKYSEYAWNGKDYVHLSTKTGETSAASDVTYNHNDSKLDATNVQQAIDKVKALLDNKVNLLETTTIQLIDYSNPDYDNKYWGNNGELNTAGSYSAFEIDVSSYIGKRIKVRAGYSISTAAGITGWSWIKKTDNSVVALSNYIQEFISNECAIVQIPKDANKLLLSWSKGEYSKGWSNPYCIYEIESEFSKLQDNVKTLQDNVETLTEKSCLLLDRKKIFLFGDSISSNDYTWYKDYLALYTGAIVYNQGASGTNAAYQASNKYFQRLANSPSDVIVVLCGGNDSGASGTIGTFNSDSPLGQMGESVVQETDISIDYNGKTFIQAISHIIRKWRSLYWNFRLAAELNANILDTQNDNVVVYPSSGTATESECITYAKSQGWTLGYGERYVMKTTETNADKRAKLIAVKQPKLFLCTTLPQRRYNSSSDWSNPQNWERKRLACIECAEKYCIPLIDLAKEFAIDWDAEPYWPGQGYSGTSKTDNQGIYTMDGLHPNEFGYAYISQIVSKHIIGDINV